MTLKVGDILRFNYLWAREAEQGEESGRKARPVCLIVRTASDPANLFLLPLTSKQPAHKRAALLVPEMECRRAGLQTPCWIILDEYNFVAMDVAYDFESLRPIGSFAAAFLQQVASRLKAEATARRLKRVMRR